MFIEPSKGPSALSRVLVHMKDRFHIILFYNICRIYSSSIKLLMATWVLTVHLHPLVGRSILHVSRYITLTFYRYTDGR
jgi:hypothetical protein